MAKNYSAFPAIHWIFEEGLRFRYVAGESGIGTEDSGSVRSSQCNGETKHNNIDSNGQSANYNNSAKATQQQHVPHHNSESPQQQDIKPCEAELALQLCNGNSADDMPVSTESLNNENNNADDNDEGDITPRGSSATAAGVVDTNGDVPMGGSDCAAATSASGADGKNYSTMTHHQEMATVTDGNVNSSEHNNQPFDLHSQASSGSY